MVDLKTEDAFMSEKTKAKIANIVIPVLSALLTVLLIIPGNQGESLLSQAIALLKAFVAGQG